MSRRLPIHRTEAVIYGELAPGPRARLTAGLHALWCDYFVGMNVEQFTRDLFKDDTQIVVGLGKSGDLAAFGYINQTDLRVRDTDYLVLGAGVFTRLEYRDSTAIHLALFWQTARLRLTNPRRKLVGITLTSNPIAYDAADSAIATWAPRPNFEPPPEALEIAHQIATRREMMIDPNDPWVVTSDIRPAQPDKLRSSRRYAQRTSAMQHFEARAPNWPSGQCLLSWAPLDAANITRSIVKLARVQRKKD